MTQYFWAKIEKDEWIIVKYYEGKYYRFHHPNPLTEYDFLTIIDRHPITINFDLKYPY